MIPKLPADKDTTTRTSIQSDSSVGISSSSDDNNSTTKSIFVVSTRNVVVEENKKKSLSWKGFWKELSLLARALFQDGFKEFKEQFYISRRSVKLTIVLLPTICLWTLLAVVIVLAMQQQQQQQQGSHDSQFSSSSSNLAMNNAAGLTAVPSLVPSDLPSMVPSSLPSDGPSSVPSTLPTMVPTRPPTPGPTRPPTPNPTRPPTRNPTPLPTTRPPTDVRITYTPGKLTVREHGLLLSEGLRCRRVARVGQRVPLDGRNDKELSDQAFHALPDGAGVLEDPNSSDGGWVYVSNSEVKEPRGRGGVGGIYFDKHGRTVDYRMLETGTTANCSGGKTPWNTWVTCEEVEEGRVFQIDPFGNRPMQETQFDRGWMEAFAFDVRDVNHPRFFVTEDKERGPIRRFSPSEKNWDDPWQLLHAPGTLEYLVLEPRGGGKGTFRWTTDYGYAKTNAAMYYPFTEGIDVYHHELFFTSKERKELFILHLDQKTFEQQSTVAGVFDGMPDQVQRIAGDGLLYFCEEGGIENGVHARDENGWYFTILESDSFNDESTGLAFSPDGKRMYVAFQKTGQIFDVWREDGLPFNGQTLNVRYHEFRQR